MRRRHLSANKSRPYHKIHHRLFCGCFQVFFFSRCPGLAQDPFLVSVTRPAYYQLLSTSELKMCFQPVSRAADGSRSQTAILGIETLCNHLGCKKSGTRAEEEGRRKDRWDKKGDAIHSDPSHFPEFLVVCLLTKSIRVRQKL